MPARALRAVQCIWLTTVDSREEAAEIREQPFLKKRRHFPRVGRASCIARRRLRSVTTHYAWHMGKYQASSGSALFLFFQELMLMYLGRSLSHVPYGPNNNPSVQ